MLCRCVSPTEVCPFCGKTYKRLKSHLPHCKAAASSRTPLTDSTASHTSSSQLESAAMAEKASQTQSLTSRAQPKTRRVSVASSPVQSKNTSSPSESLSSASPPPSTKKKKKLSEQIKAAAVQSSATSSLVSTQSHSPAPAATTSKPKKKSVRALIEAAKSPQVSKGSPEALEELPSASAGSVVDPPSSVAQTRTKTPPAKVSSKTKPPKTRPPGPKTKDSTGPLDNKVSEGTSTLLLKDEFSTEREMTELSKPGGGHRARISLQDVRAALGRANSLHHSSRPSILDHIGAPDQSRPSSSVGPVPRPAGNHSDQLANTSPQHAQSVQLTASESGGASPSTMRPDAAPSSEPTLDPRDHLSSEASRARSAPHTVGANQAGKLDLHVTHKIPVISFSHFPSFHLHPLSPEMCAMRAELLRADKVTTERWRVGITSQNMTNTGTKGL